MAAFPQAAAPSSTVLSSSSSSSSLSSSCGVSSPLFTAIRANDLSSVQKLLSASEINTGDTDGHTPLYVAVSKGRKEIVKFLLTQPSIDINAGCPVLVACATGDSVVLRQLLEYSETQHYFVRTGRRRSSVIDMMAWHATAATAAAASQSGTDSSSSSSSSSSTSALATTPPLASVLSAASTSSSSSTSISVPHHSPSNSASSIKFEKVNLRVTDGAGNTPLIIASGSSKSECLAVLLAREHSDHDDDTQLLDYINTPNHAGDTALMRATRQGSCKNIQLLLQNGADPHRRNVQGWSALDYLLASATGGGGEVLEFIDDRIAFFIGYGSISPEQDIEIEMKLLRRQSSSLAALAKFHKLPNCNNGVAPLSPAAAHAAQFFPPSSHPASGYDAVQRGRLIYYDRLMVLLQAEVDEKVDFDCLQLIARFVCGVTRAGDTDKAERYHADEDGEVDDDESDDGFGGATRHPAYSVVTEEGEEELHDEVTEA